MLGGAKWRSSATPAMLRTFFVSGVSVKRKQFQNEADLKNLALNCEAVDGSRNKFERRQTILMFSENKTYFARLKAVRQR